MAVDDREPFGMWHVTVIPGDPAEGDRDPGVEEDTVETTVEDTTAVPAGPDDGDGLDPRGEAAVPRHR